MTAFALPASNSRADRFCYPEPLQLVTAINLRSRWRNRFIGEWTDKNAGIADARSFPDIVEKAIEGKDSMINLFTGSKVNRETECYFQGILQEATKFTENHLANDEKSPQDLVTELRKVQNSKEQEILECIVRLYTYETFLYRLVNRTLRNEDMSKVNTLGAFCFLLQFYIFNIPEDTIMDDGRKCDTVYRGISFRTEDEWKKEVNMCEKKRHESMAWLAFISSSKDRNVATKFMNQDEKKYKIMYIINIASNRHFSNKKADISSISSKPLEKEVLFMSGYQFNIDHIDHGQTTTIYMSS